MVPDLMWTYFKVLGDNELKVTFVSWREEVLHKNISKDSLVQ